MKKILIYTIPVDDFERDSCDKYTIAELNGFGDVYCWTLEEFVEACNDQFINLENVWLTYREV